MQGLADQEGQLVGVLGGGGEGGSDVENRCRWKEGKEHMQLIPTQATDMSDKGTAVAHMTCSHMTVT